MRIGLSPVLLSGAIACLDPGCGNPVSQDVPSPDGRRHVVVFTRDCGATTPVSTQVSILTRSRDATGAGNVFVADTDHGKAPSTRDGSPIVHAEWVDGRTVRIRFQADARVLRKNARHDDTNVLYVAEANPASRP